MEMEKKDTRECRLCSAPAKYCCPCCSSRSCSIECVKQHKVQFDCNGERDKTAYVPLKKFTDLDFLNDYRLLEESARVVDNAVRDKVIRSGGKHFLPHWLQRLHVESKLRGTNLKILPACFKRRKQNSSCFMYRERKIYWHIEWQFAQADDISFMDRRVSEALPLSKVMAKYLDPEYFGGNVQNPLQFYQAATSAGVKVLMKDEYTAGSKFKYHEIDMSDTVKTALQGKTIVEFPTFLVILKHHIYSYPLVSDADPHSASSSCTEDSESNSSNSSTEDSDSTNDFSKCP